MHRTLQRSCPGDEAPSPAVTGGSAHANNWTARPPAPDHGRPVSPLTDPVERPLRRRGGLRARAPEYAGLRSIAVQVLAETGCSPRIVTERPVRPPPLAFPAGATLAMHDHGRATARPWHLARAYYQN